jgi:two-component system, chemotaxis family, protein-glutamate methylesterase/glutaminase
VTVEGIEVLIVSASTTLCRVMTAVLGDSHPFIVTSVSDPSVAAMRVAVMRPDVIVLDLDTERSGALILLRRVMDENPIPVVVCSSTNDETNAAIRALEIGAVEVITKPGEQTAIDEWSAEVVDVITAAAAANPRRAGATVVRPAAVALSSRQPVDLIAIGAGTGGVEALGRVLEAFPSDAPGTIIVQHMPEAFTPALAERLNEMCAIRVRHARDGDFVERGTALIVPGDRHAILMSARPGGIGVVLTDMRAVNRHRPSVDVLFHSAAVVGSRAIGVLLTGSGRDGAAGLLAMRHAGALTVAQDEATSVAFGMPRAAVELGAALRVCPLPEIAGFLIDGRPCRPSRDLTPVLMPEPGATRPSS